MLNHAIILNGPPGVGKDTLADLLVQTMPHFTKIEFKGSLYIHTADYFGVFLPTFIAMATDRDRKELKQECLKLEIKGAGVFYLSPREAMIFVSENVYKKKIGSHYFGSVVAHNCRIEGYKNIVFPDGGFIEEVRELANAGYNVSIIRLHRDGFDFSNDSRDYIDSPDAIDITLQDGNPLQAVKDIINELELELVA